MTDPNTPSAPQQVLTFDQPADYQLTPTTPFKWQMGVRPLTPTTPWFTLATPDLHRILTHKRDTLTTHPKQTSAHQPNSTPQQQETLNMVTAHLEQHEPERLTTWHPNNPTLTPLETAAHLTTEDLLLLTPTPQGLTLTSAVVCLPNKWNLLSKIGQTIETIHAPVPQLNTQLQKKISTFLNTLTPNRQYWRIGWGLTANPDLYQPDPHTHTTTHPTHIRLERETFTRLPHTNNILFTIATNIIPINTLNTNQQPWKQLFETLGTIPPDIANYKNINTKNNDIKQRH